MSDSSLIEWTDATWNPITGCSVVSPGCTNCYAMELAGTRLKNHASRHGLTRKSAGRHVWNGLTRFNAQWLSDPLRWRRPRRIFVCAHGDLFHESVPFEWIDKIWGVMSMAPRHTFQILTKRADRMREMVPQLAARHRPPDGSRWPLPNVWLGVSVEDQKRADERIPSLLLTPAAVRWLSCEPLLGPLNLRRVLLGEGRWKPILGSEPPQSMQAKITLNALSGAPRTGIPGLDWVVAGGESGSRARPMHPAWARNLRDQCAADGVPFFFKQQGSWEPVDAWAPQVRKPQCAIHANGLPIPDDEWHDDGQRFVLSGKKNAGRLLDGVEHNAMPVRS